MDRGMILTDELNEQSTTDEKRGAVVGQFPASKRDFNHENLPIEDPSLFSEDPISFEEMTAYLFEDVERNYNFSKILNPTTIWMFPIPLKKASANWRAAVSPKPSWSRKAINSLICRVFALMNFTGWFLSITANVMRPSPKRRTTTISCGRG